MIRRILIAILVVVAVAFVARLAMVVRESDTVIANAAFEDARGNHTKLRSFLRQMPKGGDLHTHLSGAVYAERFIAWAAQEQLCTNPALTLLSKPQCGPGDISAADAMHDQKLYDQLVNAFSTRAFVPTVAVPTDHDKFFAAFDKFGAVTGSRFVDMILDQLRQYHAENVQYVEFMVSFSCWGDRDKFVKAMAGQPDDSGRLAALRANGLDDCVKARRADLLAAMDKIKAQLACDPERTRPGCGATFRFIAQLLRNTTPDEVFMQVAIAAELIRTEPLIVALNLVQAEDDLIARRDYTRHMEIVKFLAHDVKVSLHAGELWLGFVPPPDLTFHIRQAIEIANALRIGHGVDLAFEHDMDGLLAEMRRRPVAVEINLSSNAIILGVQGKNHPLATYLAAGVPVVISTDDAGVSRINMTNEYFRAAFDQGLDYRTLKAIARNALIYSFLDEADKKSELERFDRRFAAFERSLARQQTGLQKALTLAKAAVTAP
jgi:adenosine deaminase